MKTIGLHQLGHPANPFQEEWHERDLFLLGQAILGHATKTIAYENYGSDVPVKALAEVIKFLLAAGDKK